MSVTYTSSNKVLDFNFGQTSYASPSIYYFGLSTTTINIDGTGATEPAGGSYARVAFTNNKTNFGVASNGILTNLVAATFAESTASWGTITYVFLSDASTSGSIWWYDALSPARTVASATTVVFAIGAVTVTLNNT